MVLDKEEYLVPEGGLPHTLIHSLHSLDPVDLAAELLVIGLEL